MRNFKRILTFWNSLIAARILEMMKCLKMKEEEGKYRLKTGMMNKMAFKGIPMIRSQR
jgi:hypothetical protein